MCSLVKHRQGLRQTYRRMIEGEVMEIEVEEVL